MLNELSFIRQSDYVLIVHPSCNFSFTLTFFLPLSCSRFITAFLEYDHEIRCSIRVEVAPNFLSFRFYETEHPTYSILIQIVLTEAFCWVEVAILRLRLFVHVKVRLLAWSSLYFLEVDPGSISAPYFVIEF